MRKKEESRAEEQKMSIPPVYNVHQDAHQVLHHCADDGAEKLSYVGKQVPRVGVAAISQERSEMGLCARTKGGKIRSSPAKITTTRRPTGMNSKTRSSSSISTSKLGYLVKLEK